MNETIIILNGEYTPPDIHAQKNHFQINNSTGR